MISHLWASPINASPTYGDGEPEPEPEIYWQTEPNAAGVYWEGASALYLYDGPAAKSCTALVNSKPNLLMACEDIPDAASARHFAALLLKMADVIEERE